MDKTVKHNGRYTKSFYEQMRDGAVRSAEAVVPLVLELRPVRSVLDIGWCDRLGYGRRPGGKAVSPGSAKE